MTDFNKKLYKSFKTPVSIPKNEEDAVQWQMLNKAWWENHPMRYDWSKQVGHEEFSKEFFNEVDKRFFENARQYLPHKNIPFDSLIDFSKLINANVLEIGVGMGSHASLLAPHSRSFTGIDLTDYSVSATSKRFEVFNLKGDIVRMDAENMQFDDNTFDFVWSWGVIHHSSNTNKIL